MKITSIIKSKSDKFYFVYFCNEKYLKVTLEEIIKFNLKEGKELSDEEINNIAKETELKLSYNYALNLLAYKEYTESEIRKKLTKKGFSNLCIENTINKLKHYNFINDYEYAKKYINYCLSKKLGKRRISYGLNSKGINFDNLHIEVQQETLLENAKNIALKKYAKIKDKQNVKLRLYNYLAYKGYDNDIILQVLKEVIKENDGD